MWLCHHHHNCIRLSVLGCHLLLCRSLMEWDTWRFVTHWGRDKMAAISQIAFSDAFSGMKMVVLILATILGDQYWITNTKQACMGSDAICVPYLLLLLPSGFDLITQPEVLIGVWPRAHPVCDRAVLSVDREITLTQPPLRAPKPGITSQPQPASQLNIGTQLTSREQTWHQSHAVAWFLNFTSYNLKYTKKHSAKEQHFQPSWTLRFLFF